MRRIPLKVALIACATGVLLIPIARLIDLAIGHRYYIMDTVLLAGLLIWFGSLVVILCGYFHPWLQERVFRLFHLNQS